MKNLETRRLFTVKDAQRILGKKDWKKTVYLDGKFTTLLLEIIKDQAYRKESSFIIVGNNPINELKNLGFNVKGSVKLHVQIPEINDDRPFYEMGSGCTKRITKRKKRAYFRTPPDVVNEVNNALLKKMSTKEVGEMFGLSFKTIARYKTKLYKSGKLKRS